MAADRFKTLDFNYIVSHRTRILNLTSNLSPQLEQLSLALSHSLPPVLASHRPTIPSWALPADKAILPAGEEEDNTEHKEGVAYWMEVKETLDREAEEMKRERRRAWEKFKGIPEGSN